MSNISLTVALVAAIVAGHATQAVAAASGHEKGAHPRFEAIDTDGDGTLTRAEFQAHMDSRFAKADANGDGVLTREELEAQVGKHQSERRARMLDRIFEKRDADGDGVLSKAEMQAGRQDRVFARVDANGDGVLSQAEFENAKHKRAKRLGHN